MLFNSFEFIFLFLPITLIGYFLLINNGKNILSKVWLVIASLYFYAYFNYSYLILIISSILVNYFIGNLFYSSKCQQKSRRLLLIFGLIFNIGVLGYFKYYDFFIKNMNVIFDINLPLLKVVLPLGISFFTFQQLSFVIDSYKRKSLKYDFLSYCLFVTFFPQLIAGPIVLPSEMLPQFENEKNKTINYENMNKGLYLFSVGLAKKVILADTISSFAIAGFDKVQALTIMEAWITSLAYTMQLYFDFSGYCDMAMGIALMFNIVLPLNFNSPYKATNIQEFWKRWHMTLGRFLTDYLYIPLGGNRKSEAETFKNLFIVFLVSGIWHGAGWMFIIWGLLHGLSILIHRVWKNIGKTMNPIIGWVITFNLVNIFWIFFRATSIKDALKVIYALFDFSTIRNFITRDYLDVTQVYFGNKISLVILIFTILISLFFTNSMEKKIKFNLISSLEKCIYLGISLLLLNRVSAFLYFNF